MSTSRNLSTPSAHDCSAPPCQSPGQELLSDTSALQLGTRRVSSPIIHCHEEVPAPLRQHAMSAELRGGVGDGYEV